MTRSTIKGPQDGAITFNEGSADVDFRVESNGNANMLVVDGGNDAVVVGQSAPDTTVSGGTPAFQVIGSGFAGAASITRRDNTQYGPTLFLTKSRNTTVGSNTIVQDDDTIGGIVFAGDDGTNLDSYVATINCNIDGTPGANDMPGRLGIFITRDGTVSQAENTRFDSFNSTDNTKLQRTSVGYNVSGGSAASRSCGLHVGGHRYYHPAMVIDDYDSSTSYATTLIQFYRNGSDCGEITATTSTTYSTSSDYRLKTDIQDMDSASETIKKLKPRKYKWKANENIDGYTNPHVNGFIAHEVQEVIPNANDMGIVTGTKDKTEEVENVVFDAKGAIAHLNVTEDKWKEGKADGTYASDTTWKAKHDKVKAQGIDYSRFTPILVKSLQEALARIETLEAEVAKLKG